VNATLQLLSPQPGPAGTWPTSNARGLAHVPALGEGEVHLWRLLLDPPSWPLDVLRGYLAPDELARARQFVFERDRDQFIAARGALRAMLGHYAGCGPGEVRFGYGAHGKPFLAGSPAAGELTFNLSHTRGLGLCAVARGRQLGVDVERIRPEVDILGIARSTFSPTEWARLEELSGELRLAAFYACWTRKEAYIKARGDGLSYPLDAFDVSCSPGEPAAIMRSADGPAEQHRWSLFAIDAGEGYAAALAVERPVSLVCLAGTA
jgi:4'-phosphopantetheinyl transferase